MQITIYVEHKGDWIKAYRDRQIRQIEVNQIITALSEKDDTAPAMRIIVTD